MVILAPMFQLGWRRASSFFLSFSSPAFIPKKGPPEAVSRILVRDLALSASCRHWKMAECSLSTGSSLTPCCSTAWVTRCPPVTRLSLLARARSWPLSMAAREAPNPAMPTTLFSTTSGPCMAASSRRPSGPRSSSGAPARPARAASSFWAAAGSVTQTARGWNSSICASSRSTWLWADRPNISNPSARTTSRLWVPMEPVDPSRVIFFAIGQPLLFSCKTQR